MAETVTQALRLDRETGEFVLNLKFGAGEHSSASPIDIDAIECYDGENNFLRYDHASYENRPAFDLVATATNGQPIRGLGEIIHTNGNVDLFVQAGGVVYDWDGQSTFSQVGTISANSRLRGNRHSTSVLDDKVIITDLNKADVVKTYDGTTFESLTTGLGTDFRAKYCRLDRERALFANIQTTTDTSHLLAGSTRGDITALSVSQRPSSALSAEDPWFLVSPDLKDINGLERAFGLVLLSTSEQGVGNMFKMMGDDATDFKIDDLYPESGAVGAEAIAHIGNDVHWGKNGRIESLIGVEAFGDVETDDVSRWISSKIEKVKGWTVKYNPRTQRAYWWPDDGNEVWVFNKFLYDTLRQAVRVSRPDVPQGLSPWTRWTTDYGNADFRVTAAEVLKDPGNKLDYTYFGFSDGTIYRMEGEGLQDAGSEDVDVYRISPFIEGLVGDVYDVRGTITYAKGFSSTVTLSFQYQGETLFDEDITVDLPAFSTQAVFGGEFYFGGDFYFGTEFEGRLQRQGFRAPGRSGAFQVKVSVSGADFDIHAIEIRFKAARRQTQS